MKFNRYLLLSSLALFTLVAAACSSATITPAPTSEPVVEEPELVEELAGDEDPFVIVNDQAAGDGTVVIEDVHATEPGWIVIHLNQDGAPGAVIGFAPVEAGENHDVVVEIDLDQAASGLFAMLHLDGGTHGEYEFPGEDAPVFIEDDIVNVPFSVTGVELAADEDTDIEGEDVLVVDSAFQGKSITVPVGTTIIWTASANLPHTVTSDDDFFDSGTLRDGEVFTFTFDEAGEFPYFCTFHGRPGGQGMAGTIIVTGE
jgi:plastocyanin